MSWSESIPAEESMDQAATEAAVRESLRRAGARFALVHGSRAGRSHRPDSDLDVAAWWGGEAPAPWDVDLPPHVDLVFLDAASLELAGRVAMDGRLLFDDDPPARVRWQAQTRLIYLDEQPRQRALSEVFRRPVLVVDERRVEHLLRRIAQDLVVLRRRARGDRASMASDRDRLDALKYTFVTAIEGCISVAQHLCASESWAVPVTNADAFRVLAVNGVLTTECGRRLARAADFRNVLVHQYAEVDDHAVVDYLDHLDDLDAFVTAVTAWMTAQR